MEIHRSRRKYQNKKLKASKFHNMDAHDLIVIGGSPRSGTSLVQKILGFHSKIYAGPEYDNLLHLTSFLQGLKRSSQAGRIYSYIDSKEIDKACRDILDIALMQAKIKSGKPFLSEKTPQNVLGFSAMSGIFENARFIWVARDPRAVLTSLKKVRMKIPDSEKSNTGFAVTFQEDLRNVLKYMSTGYDFYIQNKDICHMLNYEALVTDPESEVKKLCEFLKLEFEDRMLETEKASETSERLKESTAWYSKEMYDREMHSDSLRKWEKELTEEELRIISQAFKDEAFCSLLAYDFGVFRKSPFGMLKDGVNNVLGRKP